MQFWHDDEATAAVGLYLESVGNPRKFSRVARRLARRKPVIVVKSGASGFGVPPGHTVRRSQVPFEVVDSMLRQAGVIRVENVHQLFDVAQVTVEQPLPEGARIAIVGNSDALGTLAADACVSWGLQVVHGPASCTPRPPSRSSPPPCATPSPTPRSTPSWRAGCPPPPRWTPRWPRPSPARRPRAARRA